MSNPVLPSQSTRTQLYQIDFAAVAAGKRIASTKRRIRWRFGFANPEALANGLTGTACRGEEHDVTVVWSVASGKRLILADGHEVHFSNSRSGIIDVSWTMRGNHVLKVVAHASPPLSATPGFRQYDFYVDGQSFFSFPKVFRLGLAANDPRGFASHGGPVVSSGRSSSTNTINGTISSIRRRNSNTIATLEVEAPHNPDEEEAYLREAIRNSLEETTEPKQISSGASVASAPPTFTGDLLLDLSDSAPAYPPAAPLRSIAFNSTSSLPPAQSNALVPVGSQSVASQYGFNPAAFAAQPQTNSYPYPTATPTTSAANGYGSANDLGFLSYGAPASASSYGAPAPDSSYGAFAPASSYGAPAPTSSYGGPEGATALSAFHGGPTSSYGAPAPAGSYGAPPPIASYGAPAQTSSFGGPAPTASYSGPAPVASMDPYATQQPSAPSFGSPAPQASVSNFASPAQQQTPSTLGFASPSYFATPAAQTTTDMAPIPAVVPSQRFAGQGFAAPTPATEDPVYSMYAYNGHDSSQPQQQSPQPSSNPADQMYSKFATMDTFELVSKNEPARGNPFEVYNTVGPQPSLADMRSMSKDAPKMEVMRTPVPARVGGELVMSSLQTGSWGSQYAQPQAFVAPQPVVYAPAAAGYGAPAAQAYGQAAPFDQQGAYQQHSAYYQQAQQPQYAQQPPYDQQPQHTQQPQYGQNAYNQNQAPPQSYY